MSGSMQQVPLLLSSLLQHAERCHGTTELVSRTVEGPVHRTSYGGLAARAARLAQALPRLGVAPGDRVATLAWNGYRHMELYFGVAGAGSILHTVNPRLFPEQIQFVLTHADDQYVFLDLTFLPLVERLAPQLPNVRGYVLMTDRAHMPESTLSNLLCYEELLADAADDYDWPQFDENTAAILCYTSGTTGNPKGRAIQPSVAGAALLLLRSAERRHGDLGARQRAAGHAALPRECLGRAVCRRHVRRQAGDARPVPRRRQPVRVWCATRAAPSRSACPPYGWASSTTSSAMPTRSTWLDCNWSAC